MDDAQLRTIWQQRQFRHGAAPLGPAVTMLMKHKIGKRYRRVGKIAEIWDELVPPEIAEHTALEGFANGVLTVTVDSAPMRFQLSTLLAAGLHKQLQQGFSGTLRKVRLQPGSFYALDARGNRRYGV